MTTRDAVGLGALIALCACGSSKTQTGDAGSSDAGLSDAGEADAGVADAGGTDAGFSDAAVADSGVADAGAADSGAGDGGVKDGGGTSDGGNSIGPDGGTVSTLYFAVIGDTRPPSVNDTSGYPTAVITKIFQDIDGLIPKPEFAISTGDYMFVSANGMGIAPAAAQTAMYLTAKRAFSNTVFPAMGNHECDGSAFGNCDAGSTTPQYLKFMSSFIAPLGYSTPYYSVPIDATDGSWTSKLVVLACNAWDLTQLQWATTELGRPTTYTFLVVHEPANTPGGAPCLADVATLMGGNPVTLLINGHTHTYSHQGREVVVGNAGAPLTRAGTWGYVTVQRMADGGLVVGEYDYSTNALNDQFTIP